MSVKIKKLTIQGNLASFSSMYFVYGTPSNNKLFNENGLAEYKIVADNMQEVFSHALNCYVDEITHEFDAEIADTQVTLVMEINETDVEHLINLNHYMIDYMYSVYREHDLSRQTESVLNHITHVLLNGDLVDRDENAN